ncbi:hypothetical protein [Gemmatimonas sp.]|uniref:hypothetical protein n=1 Tax=Gemmatimonas sp. TaxID=1962908 RepID=UPI0037BEE3B2
MSTSYGTAPFTRLAQTALVVAGMVFVWSAIAAVRLTPTPTVDAGARGSNGTAIGAAVPSVTDTGIARAVEHDLFAESREAPARAYALADAAAVEPLAVAGDVMNAETPIELPTVQGTAVNATGDGFAMCAAPGGPVVVVRPGDMVGSFTVVQIERTRVVFRDAAGRRHTVEAVASPSGDES